MYRILYIALMNKLQELGKELIQFTYAIGFFSELILAILVLYVLYERSLSFFPDAVYLVGFVASVYLNRGLKEWLRGRRPARPVKFLAAENFGTAAEMQNAYGMPSGHAQQVAYSLVYLYATTGEWMPWTAIGTVIGALMVWERWQFRNHTLGQLAVGLLVGAVVGLAVVGLRDFVFKATDAARAKPSAETTPPQKEV